MDSIVTAVIVSSAKVSSKVSISDNDPQDPNSIVERSVNRDIRRHPEDADIATEVRPPSPIPGWLAWRRNASWISSMIRSAAWRLFNLWPI